MKAWHRPRIQALVQAGVDLLALETIPCQEEAEMLCDLLREFPHMKAWVSFSCKVSCSYLISVASFQIPGILYNIGIKRGIKEAGEP